MFHAWILSLLLAVGQSNIAFCSYGTIDEVTLGVNLGRLSNNKAKRQLLLQPTVFDYAPIRIWIYYDPISIDHDLSVEKRDFVKNELLPSAKQFWELALSVKRHNDPIRLDRKCNSGRYYPDRNGNGASCLSEGCKPETKCGEIVIPDEHLFACHVCAERNSRIRNRRRRRRRIYCSKQPGSREGAGIIGYDFVFYVSAVVTNRCADDKDTVAYATHCQQESELDRPIAGHVNLCPHSISTGVRDKEVLFSTVKHEMLHALGFSAGLFAFYRDSNGNPYTPRNVGNVPALGHGVAGQYFQWSNRVGKNITRAWKTRSGIHNHTVHVIVLPQVVTAVRKHFGCSELEGAELENQGGLGTRLTHWEKRVFEHEAMTGTHTQNPVYSSITFALLDDTGWYRVNRSMAQPLRWGHQLGCDFAMKSCLDYMTIQEQRNKSIAPFCNAFRGRVRLPGLKNDFYTKTSCSLQRDAITLCNLVKHTSALPPEYQNFYSLANVDSDEVSLYGGSVALADYCPYDQEFEWKAEEQSGESSNELSSKQHITFDFEGNALATSVPIPPLVRDSRCEFEFNTPDLGSNAGLEEYGAGSRCFVQPQPWYQQNCKHKKNFKHFGAGCYAFACHNGSLWLRLLNGSRHYKCFYEGQTIRVRRVVGEYLHSGELLCPACNEFCSVCNPESNFGNMIGDRDVSDHDIPCGTSKNWPTFFRFVTQQIVLCFVLFYANFYTF